MSKLLWLAVLAVPAFAQTRVEIQADCVIPFTFTATNTTPVVAGNPNTGDNRQTACVSWTVQYQSIGFTVVSLAVQSAPGPLVPGTWVNFAGTLDVGINPNTSTVGAITTMHNGATAISWMRVSATLTGTGTLNGILWGLRAPAVPAGGPPGAGCPNPCPVTQSTVPWVDTVSGSAASGAAAGNPVTTGYRDDSGNVLPDYGFPDQAAVTISAGTDTVMVTGVASTKTYVGHISFALDSAQTVTIRQGTGTTCGTNTLILYGPVPNVSSIALDFDSKGGIHTTINARDLCLHLGGAATAGGGLVYGTH